MPCSAALSMIKVFLLIELSLAIVLNGYAAVALTSILMLLIVYNWFKITSNLNEKVTYDFILCTSRWTTERQKWSKFFYRINIKTAIG